MGENNKRSLRARRKRRRRRKRITTISTIIVIIIVSSITGIKLYKNSQNKKQIEILKNEEKDKQEKEDQKNIEEEKRLEEEKNKIVSKEIVLSAAGDCTLGTDTKFAFAGSFPEEIKKNNNDYSSIMKNVSEIFKNDDYTIVNLESVFTESKAKANKGKGTTYHFKGPKEYANILKEGYIEGVTLSNNHIYDYGVQGFNDTIQTLNEYKINYCGEGYKILSEVNGIKVGFLGYNGWVASEELKNKIKADIDELRTQGAKIIIPYFHWGEEKANKPNSQQLALGRFAIDNGADMVLGSHSHVMQTIENYKGKLIAYSLGNFSFGGNSNPKDKRTFIIQAKFNLENDEIKNIQYKVIPVLISSVSSRNDYTPTPAMENQGIEILKKLNEISPTMNGIISDSFFNL